MHVLLAISIEPVSSPMTTNDMINATCKLFASRDFVVGPFDMEHEDTHDLMGYLSLEGKGVEELAKDGESLCLQNDLVKVHIHGIRDL